MAQRHLRRAVVYEYIPYYFNSTKTGQQIGSGTHGAFLGSVVISKPGSGVTITLYNGNPGGSGVALAVITPTAVASLDFNCAVDNGLYITIAGGTIGSYTVMALDQAV